MKTTRKKKTSCKGSTALALAAAACLAFAASCKKDDKAEPALPAAAAFTASTENHTGDGKTSLQDQKVLWSDGDQITVFNGPTSNNTPGYTFTVDQGGDTSASFAEAESQNVPDDFYDGSDFYAFYPANSVKQIGTNYELTLPRYQKYDANGFQSGYNPMAAHSTSSSLQFKNVCGLLELRLTGDFEVGAIHVKSETEYLSGAGTINWGTPTSEEDPGTSEGYQVPVLTMSNNAYKCVTLLCGGTQLSQNTTTSFYIVVPAGSLNKGFDIEVVNADGMHYGVKHASSGGGHVIVRSRIRPMKETNIDDDKGKDDVLLGVFSVSDDKKVHFSKGNLQAKWVVDPEPEAKSGHYEWGFAEHQYDFIGNGNLSINDPQDGDALDLFGWSTDATNFGINTSDNNDDYSGDFKEWGLSLPHEGENPDWFTISKDENLYLLSPYVATSSRNVKFAKATINEICGVLILPDEIPAIDELVKGLNKVTGSFSDNYFNKNEWKSLQSLGVVLLPAAGVRVGTGDPSLGDPYHQVSGLNEVGNYWSSSCAPTNGCAYDIRFLNGFNDLGFDFDYENGRNRGLAVRLIRNAN